MKTFDRPKCALPVTRTRGITKCIRAGQYKPNSGEASPSMAYCRFRQEILHWDFYAGTILTEIQVDERMRRTDSEAILITTAQRHNDPPVPMEGCPKKHNDV